MNKQKRMHKRAQMEAFGLAMIVVLIIIGFFLVVTLRNNNPPPDFKKDYIADELAQNFVNTLINVNVEECSMNGFTISDLIKYCAKRENITKRCSGFEACNLVNETIWKILNNTLVKRHDAFVFYTEGLRWSGSSNNEIYINSSEFFCGENSAKGQRGTIPIRLYPDPGNVFLNLDICK